MSFGAFAEAMGEAQQEARAVLRRKGFALCDVVVNAVAHDPKSGTVWAAGTRIPDDADPMLAESLRQSAEEALEQPGVSDE